MNDFEDDFFDGFTDDEFFEVRDDEVEEEEDVKDSTIRPSVGSSDYFPNYIDDFEVGDFEEEEAHDWYEEEEIIPADPTVITSIEQTENVDDNTVILDADNYAFQFRNGEWFMVGAVYGATEFSGNFPARKLS